MTGHYREWKILSKERTIYLIVLIAPVIYLFFYGFIYRHNTVTSVHIGVIDQDQTKFSRQYRQYLEADPVLKTHIIIQINEAQILLEQQKITGYIILPSHLEEYVKKGKQAVIPAYVNTSSFILANELNKRFVQINSTLSTGILMKGWQARGTPGSNAIREAIPVKVDISSIGNAGYSYGNFLLVGLFLLILHQLMLISLTESVALENEKGTRKSWFEASGRDTFNALSSKALPYYLLFQVYYLFVPTLPFRVFHIVQNAHFFELLLLGMLAFLVLGEIGLLLGSFFKTQLQALQFVAVMSVPIFLTCGFSWPIEQLPLMIQLFNYLLPTHFLLLPFQSMTQMGSSLQEQFPSIITLCAQAAIYFLLLKWRYSKVFRKVEFNGEADTDR